MSVTAVLPDEELQEQLRATAREILQRYCTPEDVRGALSGPGHVDGLWGHAAAAGWLGVEVPEEHNGAGMTFAEVAVLLTEMGRHLAPAAYLATMLALPALAGPGGGGLLEAVAEGDLRLTVAINQESGGLSGPGFTAVPCRGGWVLNGSCSFVPAAEPSTTVVAVAGTETGPLVVLVAPPAPGWDVQPAPTQDLTRGFADVTARDVQVPASAVLAEGPDAGALVARLHRRGALALGCDSLGVIDRVIEVTTAYLKQREQFGRVIGSFQALKHRMADLVIAAETSRVAVADACRRLALAPDDPETAQAVAMTAAYVPDTAVRVAGEGISLHGGIGYTWEHDMHLLLRRAVMNRALYGDSRWHREHLSALLLPEVPSP